MITYDEIFTFKNLYIAHQKARKSKRHKKDVIYFELDLCNNLWKLKKELDSRTYKVHGYHHFMIYEPKKRSISALSYEDRVVQHCLVDNYLMPVLERHLIYDNAATRINKGTDFARSRVKNFLQKFLKNHQNGYVLQFDIHHYFESINHLVLKEKLKNIITDEEVLSLLYNIIDSYSDNENQGLPIGNQTSQCFALYYLDKIDRIIKEEYKIKYYSRYMDDGIIIHHDKETLQKLLDTIFCECQKLKITLNKKKTRIYSLKEGFVYLGFRYRIFNQKQVVMSLPKKNKKRIVKYLKKTNFDSLLFYKNYLKKGKNFYFYQKISNLAKKVNK